ncbi:hypothetical protein ACFLYF_04000 [Chloroflexota bacterium]
MKKLLLVVSLTAVLLACIFGGIALAAPPGNKVVDTPIFPVVIETGGDIDETLDDYSGWHGTGGWVDVPGTAHVSLTVSTEGMIDGDYLAVYITYVDKETGDEEYQILKVLDWNDNSGDGSATIEFDAAKGETYGNWQLAAMCNHKNNPNDQPSDPSLNPGYKLYYNYTMTYPKQ